MKDFKKRFKVFDTMYTSGLRYTCAVHKLTGEPVIIKDLSLRAFKKQCLIKGLDNEETRTVIYFQLTKLKIERLLLSLLESDNIIKLSESGKYGSDTILLWHKDNRILNKIYPTMTLPQLLWIFTEVCRGIEHLHSHGVIHRDIRPSNIIVNSNKVLLWNLLNAKSRYSVNPPVGNIFTNKIGNPQFASPEQIENPHSDAVDVQSDVFTLGMSIYYCLTGCHPHKKDWWLKQSAKCQKSNPEVKFNGLIGRRYNKKVIQELNKVVKAAIEHRKCKRTKTVQIFRQQLEEIWTQLPI